MSKRGASENVSVVYFALDREAMLMKVGRTEDEGKRRTSLQTGNGRTFEWLGSIPGGEAEERKLHAALVAWDPTCRARGEWFRVTEELVERACGPSSRTTSVLPSRPSSKRRWHGSAVAHHG